MKKLFSFLLPLLLCSNVFSQNVSKKVIAEYEDTLKVMAHGIMNGETEEQRREFHNGFIKELEEVLHYKQSFRYPFDSLITISCLTSGDNKFRLFNWILKLDNGKYQYFCLVQIPNKKKNENKIIRLTDNSENIRVPETKKLDQNNWYGALYYDIVYIKKKGRQYYTLLGWDGNDGFSTKKIIDVMHLAGRNIKFGHPIFRSKKQVTNRVIVEYDSKTSVSVKYHEKGKQIVMDHLVPVKKMLEGLHEYYVPDGTYDAYIYNNGKWEHKENIDIGIKEKSPPKIKKKNQKGLLPR